MQNDNNFARDNVNDRNDLDRRQVLRDFYCAEGRCAASAVNAAKDLGTVWTLAPLQALIPKYQVTISWL